MDTLQLHPTSFLESVFPGGSQAGHQPEAGHNLAQSDAPEVWPAANKWLAQTYKGPATFLNRGQVKSAIQDAEFPIQMVQGLLPS